MRTNRKLSLGIEAMETRYALTSIAPVFPMTDAPSDTGAAEVGESVPGDDALSGDFSDETSGQDSVPAGDGDDGDAGGGG